MIAKIVRRSFGSRGDCRFFLLVIPSSYEPLGIIESLNTKSISNKDLRGAPVKQRNLAVLTHPFV